jgi:hypothetical protein
MSRCDRIRKFSWPRLKPTPASSRRHRLPNHHQITTKTHHHWRQNDPAYAEAFEQTKRLAGNWLECALLERAISGWSEPVFYQGRQCGSVRRFSDAAAMFLLKHLMPEKAAWRSDPRPQDRPNWPNAYRPRAGA